MNNDCMNKMWLICCSKYCKKKLGTAVWEAPVWEHRPQMEDALLAPPYSSVGAPADDYLGAAGGDALTRGTYNNGDLGWPDPYLHWDKPSAMAQATWQRASALLPQKLVFIWIWITTQQTPRWYKIPSYCMQSNLVPEQGIKHLISTANNH
jgi:hypothetical protein